MPKEGTPDGDQNLGTGITIQTEDGEKKFSVEDVQNLHSQAAKVSQSSQKVANILKTVERYQTDPDTYLENAEAAFGVVNTLIEQGIVDDKGNLVEKKVPEVKPRGFAPPAGEPSGTPDKTLQIVMKALTPELEKFGKRLDGLEDGQAGLYRERLTKDVKAKYSDFDDEDISKLFGKASVGRDSLWDIAEVMAGEKKIKQGQLREAHAKEFGINLEEHDRNKLQEQDADGGVSAAFKGKKFMFRSRAKRTKDKDAVSPKEAMLEHMSRLGS